MKKLILLSFCIFVQLNLTNVSAQIGIGTITPRGALEINSATNGLVPPQVALTSTNASAPVVNPQTAGAPIAGTVIYNTATAGAGNTAVTPGFYYWDGALWLRLAIGANSDWALTGNSGTVAGTNYVGTNDAVGLRIRTNGTDRWNISNTNSGQLQSYSLGTAALPVYSFQTDQNTGIFSPVADNIAIATNGTEKARVDSNGNVGIATTAPSNRLHVVNNVDGEGVIRTDNGTAGGFTGVYFYQGASYRGHIGYVNTGGASGFGGKGYYQLAAGDRPMIFSTNSGSETYQEKMIIAQDGRVGINTNPTNLSTTIQPNSTLQVNGSLAIKTAFVGTTSALANDICKVFLSNGGTNITITLPDPATCAGRLISFTRFGSSTGTVTLTPSAGNIQDLNGTIVGSTTVGVHSASGGGVNIQFWSSGSTWYR